MKTRMQMERDPALAPIEIESDQDVAFELVSVLDGRLLEVFQELPEEMLTCSEMDLCNQVDPTPSDYKMRQNFHEAVAVARAKGKRLRVTSIYEDVVARQTFFNFYVPNQKKMAFITRPVVGHHQYLDAIWKEGLRKMFLFVRNHDLDPKNMATFMRIVEKAGDRVIGPVAQRIQMHSKQEITESRPRDIEVNPEDPRSMQAKIDEMQAKVTAMTNKQLVEKVIDVESED